MSARGPRSTRTRDWSWSASTRPSSRSSETPRTSARAATDMRVDYPIAVDSDYAVWDAFANRYWPAVYIADARGRIRHHHSARAVRGMRDGSSSSCWARPEREGIGDDLVSIAPDGFEAQADWDNLGSPETYLGYQQARELRLSRWRRARRVSLLCGAGFAEAQRLGALRGLDGREGGQRAEPSRRADRVSLPRPRRQSGLATADARGVGARSASSSTELLPEPTTGSTSTQRATERSCNRGSTSLSASKERSPTAPSRSRSSRPASRPTCSRSARRRRRRSDTCRSARRAAGPRTAHFVGAGAGGGVLPDGFVGVVAGGGT